MPDLDELLAQVDGARDEIIALEQALVRIPSVNTGFMPTGDETVCALTRMANGTWDTNRESPTTDEIRQSALDFGRLVYEVVVIPLQDCEMLVELFGGSIQR